MRPLSPVLSLTLLLLTAAASSAATPDALETPKPSVRLLTPVTEHPLLIGDSCTVSWQGVGITGVIMDLVFDAVPASQDGPAQPPRAVALGTAPGASGTRLVHLTQDHAAVTSTAGTFATPGRVPADGTATLRIRGTTPDGGTVEDRRPVSLLVPLVELHVPTVGTTLTVGVPVTARWTCPRAKPDRAEVFVGYDGPSLGTITSWREDVPNTGTCRLTIPASALHAGSRPEEYLVGVRLVFPTGVYTATVRDCHHVILKP